MNRNKSCPHWGEVCSCTFCFIFFWPTTATFGHRLIYFCHGWSKICVWKGSKMWNLIGCSIPTSKQQFLLGSVNFERHCQYVSKGVRIIGAKCFLIFFLVSFEIEGRSYILLRCFPIKASQQDSRLRVSHCPLGRGMPPIKPEFHRQPSLGTAGRQDFLQQQKLGAGIFTVVT